MDHLKPERCKDYLFMCLDMTALKEAKALKCDTLPYTGLVANLKQRFGVEYDERIYALKLVNIKKKAMATFAEYASEIKDLSASTEANDARLKNDELKELVHCVKSKSIRDAAELCESKKLSNCSLQCSAAQSGGRLEKFERKLERLSEMMDGMNRLNTRTRCYNCRLYGNHRTQLPFENGKQSWAWSAYQRREKLLSGEEPTGYIPIFIGYWVRGVSVEV
ncbi:hypothetical protein RF11_04814 [Thelohanellus kitauei]|uniref:Uncharacterized protein n=1 Tax=Thelohanellus kitauei TaxID=669202 RepID=A0A0C2M7L0_THEKT|nr:hypothetical protein RF11_04814 [Thelohanellus kitauei]